MVEDNNIHCSSTIASFHDDEDDFFHDYPSLPSWIDEETSSMMEAEAKQMKKMFVSIYSFDQLFSYVTMQSLYLPPFLICCNVLPL